MNTEFDFSIAFIGTLLLFEAARRVVGWPMLTVALFLCFMLLPARICRGFWHIAELVCRRCSIIFSLPQKVFLVLHLAYLQHLFISLSYLVPIWKLRVWASCLSTWLTLLPAGPQADLQGCRIIIWLMGTVSGSSVANVAGTGAFTIPMMKKLGYRPAFAGAVEAAASTGGQLMPPVMGAAAFLMAEFVGVPYIEVVKAAVIPALLYYIGVWIGVHYEAKKFGLKGTPRDQLPKFGKLFMEKAI